MMKYMTTLIFNTLISIEVLSFSSDLVLSLKTTQHSADNTLDFRWNVLLSVIYKIYELDILNWKYDLNVPKFPVLMIRFYSAIVFPFVHSFKCDSRPRLFPGFEDGKF